MSKFIDLTGRKIGKLTVIKRAENKGHNPYWLCKCECGNYKEIVAGRLTSSKKRTNSCGCLNKIKRITHGHSHSRLYRTYHSMKARCYNKNNDKYPNYGGRGIQICREWDTFDKFLLWALESGYSDDLTIDRINVDKNYEPSNCRWATAIIQQNNKTNNKVIRWQNETKTISEWSRVLNIQYQTLYCRLYKLNWSIEKAFTTI